MASTSHCLVTLLFAVATLAVTGVADRRVTDLLTGLPDYGPFKSRNYAGYVDVGGGSRSFYYLVESERSPATDPLLLWLNGGPGCSSLIGLFTEIGPYTLRHGGGFFNNDYNWASTANVLFLESPLGVGFSKNTESGTVWTDNQTAQLNYRFLVNWLELWPSFQNRSFYIAGESYAGHYIPQLASAILHGSNTTLRSMLRGIMAGNPCTGTAFDDASDWCFTTVDPTLTEWFQSHAFTSFSSEQNVPLAPCDQTCPIDPSQWTQYDPYDTLERFCPLGAGLLQAKWLRQESGDLRLRRSFGGPPAPYGPCADYYLGVWLNRPDVQLAIHADVGTHWEECSNINYPTPTNLPGVKPIYQDLMANTNWSILIYSGTADTVVNFIQTEKVVISMNRTLTQPFSPWYYQDMYNSTWKQLGGFYVNYDRISWASVIGAGHMVPQYVPAAAFQLLTSFLATGRPGLPSPTTTFSPTQALSATPSSNSGSIALEMVTFLAGVIFGSLLAGLGVFLRGRKSGTPGKPREEYELVQEAR